MRARSSNSLARFTLLAALIAACALSMTTAHAEDSPADAPPTRSAPADDAEDAAPEKADEASPDESAGVLLGVDAILSSPLGDVSDLDHLSTGVPGPAATPASLLDPYAPRSVEYEIADEISGVSVLPCLEAGAALEILTPESP